MNPSKVQLSDPVITGIDPGHDAGQVAAGQGFDGAGVLVTIAGGLGVGAGVVRAGLDPHPQGVDTQDPVGIDPLGT